MSNLMTFEQFQATRASCEDLGKVLGDESLMGKPGLLYCGTLYIDDVTEDWPEAARKDGKYHLLIERAEWISNDLEDLERELYRFACEAGYCDRPVEKTLEQTVRDVREDLRMVALREDMRNNPALADIAVALRSLTLAINRLTKEGNHECS